MIHYAAVSLEMSEHTRAKALVFFHRYYAQRSTDGEEERPEERFLERTKLIPPGGAVRRMALDRKEPEYGFLIAAACLFLASKCSVLEQPVKLGSIVTAVYAVRHPEEECLRISSFYWRRKDEVILAEHDLLKTLRFDVGVTLAFNHLLAFLRLLEADQQLTSMAITACSDCYRTPLCLRFAPNVLAVGAINVAASGLGVTLPTNFEVPWYSAMGATDGELQDIKNAMLLTCKQPPISREELREELTQPPLGSGHDAVAEKEQLYSASVAES